MFSVLTLMYDFDSLFEDASPTSRLVQTSKALEILWLQPTRDLTVRATTTTWWPPPINISPLSWLKLTHFEENYVEVADELDDFKYVPDIVHSQECNGTEPIGTVQHSLLADGENSNSQELREVVPT